MARPSKPFKIIEMEGKSHRTKAEMNKRKQGEESLISGQAMKEFSIVKNNPIAHKEFTRLKKLLEKIEKNDALYQQIINRYCLIVAECSEFEDSQAKFYRDLDELTSEKEDLINSEEFTPASYYKMKNSIQQNIIALDRQLQTKRKMLLDIEKECVMTIASSLRSIPKQADNDKDDPLLKILRGG